MTELEADIRGAATLLAWAVLLTAMLLATGLSALAAGILLVLLIK